MINSSMHLRRQSGADAWVAATGLAGTRGGNTTSGGVVLNVENTSTRPLAYGR